MGKSNSIIVLLFVFQNNIYFKYMPVSINIMFPPFSFAFSLADSGQKEMFS